MKSVGIDVGTTTICGVVTENRDGSLLESCTWENDTWMAGEWEYEKLQDPDQILKKCREMLDYFLKKYDRVTSIGVTGQMHGILYLDGEGKAVSPLFTWQDGRGDEKDEEGISFVEKLSKRSGRSLATGFGIVTHAWLSEKGKIPVRAKVFCTIPDYVAMSLAGRKAPLIHSSMAASFGMFDVENGCYEREKLEELRIPSEYLPMLGKEQEKLGCYQGIPVSLAIGDNQASFLGAVEGSDRMLLNLGTGGQISAVGTRFERFENLECRPYIGGDFLYVGSSLCGGRAYEILKNFFGEALELFGGKEPQNLYELMNDAGQQAMRRRTRKLIVDTRFQGSRKKPDVCGKIEGIGTENFHPGELILGVLEGMCQELYEFYEELSEEIKAEKVFTVSGNAVRKNPLLQSILEEKFGMQLHLSRTREEAASGAAAFSRMEEKRRVTEPIFFEKNRVRRVYIGGALFGKLTGIEEEDGHKPEEWISSVVEAINGGEKIPGEGLSVLEGTDLTLKELLLTYPKELLGDRSDLGILVKLLDSAVRLPIQVHPDKEFSRTYFHSEHGKTELWYILDTRPDAAVFFGFRNQITREEFERAVEASREDKDAMEGLLHRIPVKKGEVYYIPAKAVHAIGQGCLILEIQEPTDFTIQPEYWCGDYLLNEEERYLGLPKETALDCFDFSLCGEKAGTLARKDPRIVREEKGLRVSKFLSGEETECFDLDLWKMEGTEAPLEGSACIYMILDGEGEIRGEGYQRKIRKGEFFFLPAAACGRYELRTSGKLSFIRCIPPQKSNPPIQAGHLTCCSRE